MQRNYILITALLACLGQAACVQDHDEQSSSQPSSRHEARALQPGDKDYPESNPAPTQIVKFTAIMPDALATEFHLKYLVETSQDTQNPNVFHSPPGCGWTQDRPFFIDAQLALKKSGDRYTGSFSPDLFQAGSCQWHLYAITSSITNTPVVFMTHSLHTSSHPLPDLDLTTDLRHFWCVWKKDGEKWPTAANQTINCVPFAMSTFWAKLPKGFEESIPIEMKQQGSHVINQYLSNLTIEFHNLDAAVADYTEGTQRSSPVASDQR